MNTTKHTPGPWELNSAVNDDETLDAENHERYVLSKDGVLIADCYADTAMDFGLPETFAEAQANARLIKTAPKLLDAVKQWEIFLSADCTDGKTLTAVRKLIAEAEGKQRAG